MIVRLIDQDWFSLKDAGETAGNPEADSKRRD